MTRHCLLSLLLLVPAVLSLCPDGWTGHADSCYLFSDLQATWPNAGFYCLDLGAKLASIEDGNEQTWLKAQLSRIRAKEVAANTLVSYWTSGNDVAKEGVWVWANNVPDQYTSWGTGEPNNARGANCLALHSLEGFSWNDDYCETAKNYFICEMRAGEAVIVG